ncbi:enoyl-CoA hydratase/isomerase family protein [Tomitella biformata]|uniref:enoyl-CoA hydratase/isomerase family protein n=1 Tax=Tomitella biformata TaxID=630403 RepID=UPI00046444B2|nr:enoyl-CoA hydratase/isomerase family protein [Tomitella biformata]
MPFLEKQGDVFIWYLGTEGEVDSEARFSPDWLSSAHAILDEVEQSEGPAALVTTATGKFFSNGLDLEYILPRLDQLDTYLDSVHEIFHRLVQFPVPTVAAIQGHAFGAGAMLATAHDFRVMRSDRGFYCLPEVTLQMPFTPSMTALITSRLPGQTALEAMSTGRRFGGADALTAGIVDQTETGEDLLAAAVARVAPLAALRGPNLGGIKAGIHADLLVALAAKTTGTRIGG